MNMFAYTTAAGVPIAVPIFCRYRESLNEK